ncbi:Hpt domain-containing protein [Chitinophaga sp. S165]|uniref:Hpt domain-containing protein n=1 Tax=Chitinophaga sp. S165 TaxID=2135462 RepID=UPI000D709BEA|nr:Hpt domain-containing protein [Chitinophaga sp. S165]PWV55533.1 Hpt domain-containing protein [Chitinophaga sp. S165]
MSFHFTFDSRLDVRYLQAIYESNLTYAAKAFGVFIETFPSNLDIAREAIESKRHGEGCICIHRLKGGLAFVGLTQLEAVRAETEELVRSGNVEQARQKFALLNEQFQETLPIIQKEYDRLCDFIKTCYQDVKNDHAD